MATTNSKINIVTGIVTDVTGQPLSNLKVEIFDIEMRNWQSLGHTITNKNGLFELGWKQGQLGREKKNADIAVKVSTVEKGTEIFRSAMDTVRFNAGPFEKIDIIVKNELPVERIEYDWLVKEVNSLSDKVAINELE